MDRYTNSDFKICRVSGVLDWSEFHIWCFRLCDIRRGESQDNSYGQLPVELCDTKSLGLRAGAVATATALLQIPSKTSASEVYKHVHHQVVQLNNLIKHKIKKRKCGALCSASSGFTAGAISGGMATYSTHWLDTVKVKMQTYPAIHRCAYKCMRHTMNTEGVRGLYRGASPAVFGQMCKTAIVFMSYELCQDLVSKATGCDKDSLATWQRAWAGAMTGVISSFVLCPMELVKCRKQALHANPLLPRHSSVQIARLAFKHSGISGLYRGLPGIWAKEVPGSFIYLGSYELTKDFVKHLTGANTLSPYAVFVCGMTAGLCYCVTHPIESVKTRVQVMSAVSPQGGFMASFANILKTEGIRPLMNGLGPCVVRSCLYSGIQFVIYEYFRARFQRR